MPNREEFNFTVDLAVVESLGINLYSNAAAVLSELVANAWDADANTVSITWDTDNEEIIIQDDGSGMTRHELNSRFLTVAYKKRPNEGITSPKFNRPFMGRKGIGKLSVFSLAEEVEVISRKEGETNGFKIELSRLKHSIETSVPYKPIEVDDFPDELQDQGTRIVLRQLNRRRTAVSITALRRRIARRFDVLNFQPEDEDKFEIIIDGETVDYEDREDLKRIEYMWHLGDREVPESKTPKVRKHWTITDNIVDVEKGWKVEGWFGTVKKPEELNDDADHQESLRNILILARRRPIQEGIIDQLSFNKMFGNYVTGQIRAEFLDLDDDSDDIATSDRQRLIEDDARVRLLVEKLRSMFNRAAEDWSKQRPKDRFRDLTETYPTVREWVEKRPTSQKQAAERLIGSVAALPLEEESQRRELFKASILAFERIAIEETTEKLEQIGDNLEAADLLPILASAKSYEDALYIQILRSRLQAVEKLENLMDLDEKEKVLQQHLFDNMWLLDPSWEGATQDADMEKSLSRLRDGIDFSADEKSKQELGRIDIRYTTNAGVHMIVELKKYRRRLSIEELRTQGAKYHRALDEILRKKFGRPQTIAVVFVLGEEPRLPYTGTETSEEYIDRELSPIGGRILYYDKMLDTAQKQYKSYRDRRSDLSEMISVLGSLDGQEETGAS